MAGSRARTTHKDHHGSVGNHRMAANDEAVAPPSRDVPHLTLPEAATLTSRPANDDWIAVDLPISIKVLDEEIAILDQFLRARILALFA